MKITSTIGAALFAVYVFWGATYLAMKVAIETLPPYTMSGIRFISAGAILYIWQISRGFEKPKVIHWKNAAIVGGVMLLGGNGTIVWAEQFIPSGIAAIIFAIVPFWVALLSWLWQGGERPNGMVCFGLVLGFIGIILLVKNTGADISSTSSPWFAYLALLLASFFWAVGTLHSRVAKLPSVPLLSAALQMLTGGIICLIFGFMIGEWKQVDFTLISTRSLLSLGYLIFFGSIIGHSAYLWLLKVTDPTLVTTNTYVNPVVAVILGWAIAGEQMTHQSAFAAAIIVFSVIIVHKGNNIKTVFTERKKRFLWWRHND